MDALKARWPRADDSPGAREIDGLGRQLGIHLVRSSGGPPVEDQKLYDSATGWLSRLSKSHEDGFPALPADVRALLDSERETLASMVARLNTTSYLAWKMDLDAGPEAPVPSLLAHRYLNTLVLLDAVERHRRGDRAGAEQALDAAWRHSETLADRPELISVLIAEALTINLGVVLRRIPEANSAWNGRLEQRRFHREVIDRFQSEAYSFAVLTRGYRGAGDMEEAGPAGNNPVDWTVRILSVPFVRISMARISHHLRRGRALALASDPCRVTGEEMARIVSADMTRWDTIPKIAVPSVVRAVTSGAAADLDSELTRRVLVLEVRRGGRPGNEATSAVPSGVCDGLSWRQVRQRDGGWTIGADPAPALHAGSDQRWIFTIDGRTLRR
jgi:hypothetical protein